MPDFQLSFHGTFALKKQDLLSIVKAATESDGLADKRQGLMKQTKLGNEKVLRIRGWALRSGLVSGKYLSTEGKLVWQHDQALATMTTDWLMHFYLSFGTQGQKNYKGKSDTLALAPTSPADWGGWTYLVYEFLPQYSSFTLSQLVQHSAAIFPKETEKRLTENFKILLKTYCLPPNRSELSPLRATQFLTLEGDQFSTGQPNLPSPYLLGYFLAQLWQRDFDTATSVLAIDILHQPLGLAPCLGISLEKLQSCLNQLETYGIIEQRRTVSPAQIIRRWDNPLALLEKALSETAP